MFRTVLEVAGRSPARLLITVWIGALALYALGPVRYEQVPRPMTWLFVAACLATFCLGAWAATRFFQGSPSTPRFREDTNRLDQVVRLAAIVGLVGAACITVDKVVFSGLDFSQGVTALRFGRAEALETGTGELQRSPLLYLGYLTFSFSVASFLLYLLKGDHLRRSTAWFAYGTLTSIFVYSYLYAGRTPLALVIGMACGAIAVRLLSHQPALPRAKTARILFALFIALAVAYSEAILSDRLVVSGVTNYTALETRFETSYGATAPAVGEARPAATVAPALPAPPEAEAPASSRDRVFVQLVYNLYYFTHELPVLDRTLAYEGPLGPYYGAYQFYLPAAVAQRLLPSSNIEPGMVSQLKAANVYGWYSTAWGGMYLDFGLVGALAGVLLSGWFAGRVYRRALGDDDVAARLLMCYVVAGILATPLLSIFTISISLPILVALLITAGFLRYARVSRVPTAGAAFPRRDPASLG